MSRAMVVVVLGACAFARHVSAQPATAPQPAPSPSRFIAHVTMHHGLQFVNEDIDNGATGPGVAFGLQLGAQYRLTPFMSLGVALDATMSEHDSDASAGADAKYTHYFLPTAVGRFELGRFALVGWAGYHMGHRSVTEPGGLFGSRSLRSDDVRGIVLAGGGVVRFLPPNAPVHVEIGPFMQSALMTTTNDSGGIRTLVFGLVFQAAYGAPPVGGD